MLEKPFHFGKNLIISEWYGQVSAPDQKRYAIDHQRTASGKPTQASHLATLLKMKSYADNHPGPGGARLLRPLF
jgi:hypothetical protein